jgi:hypothetical protein
MHLEVTALDSGIAQRIRTSKLVTRLTNARYWCWRDRFGHLTLPVLPGQRWTFDASKTGPDKCLACRRTGHLSEAASERGKWANILLQSESGTRVLRLVPSIMITAKLVSGHSSATIFVGTFV